MNSSLDDGLVWVKPRGVFATCVARVWIGPAGLVCFALARARVLGQLGHRVSAPCPVGPPERVRGRILR
jgi:hypothetical protein